MILPHLANALYLLAYLVKDILWLRIVSCLAGLLLLAGFVTQPQLPWGAVAWNLIFFTINAWQARLLILERRPVRLGAEEQRLYQLVFRSLRPREFRRLLAVGAFRDHAAGEILVEPGRSLERLMVIVDGEADVHQDGQHAASLGPGGFVGEMSFLSGQPPAAEVRARAALRVATWPADALRRFLDGNPELRAAWQLVIGADLVRKLRRPTRSAAA